MVCKISHIYIYTYHRDIAIAMDNHHVYTVGESSNYGPFSVAIFNYHTYKYI